MGSRLYVNTVGLSNGRQIEDHNPWEQSPKAGTHSGPRDGLSVTLIVHENDTDELIMVVFRC